MIKQFNKNRPVIVIMLCAGLSTSLSLQASSVDLSEHHRHARPGHVEFSNFGASKNIDEVFAAVKERLSSHVDLSGHDRGQHIDRIFASIKERLADHVDVPGNAHRHLGGHGDWKAWKGGWQEHADRWQKLSDRLDTIAAFRSDKFCHLEMPAVPVPAAAWLFGTGLLGLVGVARRKG
jgi:hypothetical protein